MNNTTNKARATKLIEQITRFPQLLNNLEEVIALMTNESGEFEVADEVEEKLIPLVRSFGKEAFQGWANTACEKKTTETQKTLRATKKSKKNFTG